MNKKDLNKKELNKLMGILRRNRIKFSLKENNNGYALLFPMGDVILSTYSHGSDKGRLEPNAEPYINCLGGYTAKQIARIYEIIK